MKYLSTLLLLTLLILSCQPTDNQDISTANSEEETVSPYDSLLATELEADDYGMSQYVMAFLKAGPNRDQDSTTRAELQKAHLDNIMHLANKGKLVLAGPFLEDSDLKGIYIFNVKTVEEAKALTETDPAIQAGSLVMELHPWYGSATVKMVNDWHKKVSKEEI